MVLVWSHRCRSYLNNSLYWRIHCNIYTLYWYTVYSYIERLSPNQLIDLIFYQFIDQSINQLILYRLPIYIIYHNHRRFLSLGSDPWRVCCRGTQAHVLLYIVAVNVDARSYTSCVTSTYTHATRLADVEPPKREGEDHGCRAAQERGRHSMQIK